MSTTSYVHHVCRDDVKLKWDLILGDKYLHQWFIPENKNMKLKELRINEGLVDISVLMALRQVATSGTLNGVSVTTISKALMAIEKGYTFSAINFNAYFNEFDPPKNVIDAVKGLSKENAQQLALFILQTLEAKNTQLASLGSFKSIGEILAYATRAEAND